jgi:F-type H+-transporting ATPase subunit gamma
LKTLKELRRRIGSVEDMESVVSTMKSLAAARIRQYETAADATQSYGETVELALQILMRSRVTTKHRDLPVPSSEPIGLVLLGSDQGFCGRFNEVVLESAVRFVRELTTRAQPPLVLTVGSRLAQLAESSDVEVNHRLNVASSVEDITTVLQRIIPQIENWQRQFGVRQIELFYNQRRSTASLEVRQLQLLPVSNEYLNQLGRKKWQSRSLPIHQGNWRQLFAFVIRQYLFLQMFRACAESLASENASRMAAMQHAEKNIEERLDELNSEFNHNRQRSITDELLEIMSGFEAVTQDDMESFQQPDVSQER